LCPFLFVGVERRELLIDEESEKFGIEAISLVTYPAIEENFVFFSSHKKEQYTLAKIDEDKQVLVGPALIPNKDIYRVGEDGEEFNVFFSPATVQKAAHLFMRQSNTHAATLQHETEATGVHLLESWVVENPEKDKQQVYGFDFPAGTWMVAMKIEDSETWEGVKTGDFRGFSIEGYFVDRLVEMNKEEMNKLEQIKAILFGEAEKQKFYAEEALEDGRKLATEAEEMAVGVPVVILDEEMNPVEAEPGEYTLANGTKVVVGEGGVIESLGEGEEAPAEEEMETTEDFTDAQLEKIKGLITEAVTAALAPQDDGVVEELAKHVRTIADRVGKLEEAPAAEFKREEAPKKKQSLADIVAQIK
jgi:hypothetical protein